MRRIALSIALLITCSLFAIEKVQFPESFANGWEPYVGNMVQITTPLYVCGNYYDSLILAPERLYVPEERAMGLEEGDSTVYWAIKQSNRAQVISLTCNIQNYFYDLDGYAHPKTTKEQQDKSKSNYSVMRIYCFLATITTTPKSNPFKRSSEQAMKMSSCDIIQRVTPTCIIARKGIWAARLRPQPWQHK